MGDQTFLWSLRHEHETDESGDFANRYRDCRDVVTLRLHGTPGRALVTFRAGEGRLVSDGILPAGTVGAAAGRALNLNEPGTVRALLDEAVARGWNASTTTTEHIDGWQLFDAVADRRLGR